MSEDAGLKDPPEGAPAAAPKPCDPIALVDGEPAAQSGRLPYPGLRSFKSDEADIFFGREGCVDAMLAGMAAARFLAVLGASGSGKSSLVRTGLLEALRLGFHPSGCSRWKVADFAPGAQPLTNLARAVLEAQTGEPPSELEVESFRAFLKCGPRSLAEWSTTNVKEGWSLLVIADQFEELFRFGDYTAKEEAEALVSLLIESSVADAPIHVVLTMRSEYLGACSLIPRLAEAISDDLYLTPRMTREDCAAAIEGPAGVLGFSIEPALVNRLLNDLTNLAPWEPLQGIGAAEQLSRQADQLPLMQHVLNRLYLRAARAAPVGEPTILRMADYDGMGGLAGALDAHGAEIQDELTARIGPDAPAYIERIFRALVEGPSLVLAVRRPAELGDLVQIAGCSTAECVAIVQAFAGVGRNFLRTSRPLNETGPPDAIVDISHEALIRQWSALARWFKRETESAANWRSLVRSTERYALQEGDLLTGTGLAYLKAWWGSERPAAAWAGRYSNQDGDFARVEAFLETSDREYSAGIERERARERREKNAILVSVFVALAILALGGVGGAIWLSGQRDADRVKLSSNAARRTEAITQVINQACSPRRVRPGPDRDACFDELYQLSLKSLGNAPPPRRGVLPTSDDLPGSPLIGGPPPAAAPPPPAAAG